MLPVFTLMITFLIGLVLTPVLIQIIKKQHMMDEPGGRKIHQSAVPSMGGIAIMMAMAGGVVFSLTLQELEGVGFLMLGLSIMFFLGLMDDMVELTASQKLVGQLVAIFVVVVLGDIRVSGLYGFMGVDELPLWLSYGVTVFAVVGLTNAFNLIDGLDGLAGTLSVIPFLFLGVWFMETGFYVYGLVSLAMLGAILAFMVYNWHPAKIFMGDTGSLTIGFLLSVFSVCFAEVNGVVLPDSHAFKFHAPITAGLALMLIPGFDTLRVFVRRLKRGKNPLAADKSHIHHFLLRMGFRHDQVACILGAVKLFFMGMVILTAQLTDTVLLPLVIVSVITLGAVLDVQALRRVRRNARNAPPVLVMSSYGRSMKSHYRSKSKEREKASV